MIWLLALWLGLAVAEEPAADKPFDWYAIPVGGVDTDDGAGGGVRAEIARVEEGYAPYKWALMVHGYVTTTGYQHHRVRFDRVGLGARRRLRLTARASWRAWKNDGYWGVGNGTVREAAFVGTFDREDPRRKRYMYSLLQPFGYLTLRQELGEQRRWEGFASFNPKWSRVSTYDGSLLAEEQPFGMAGGFTTIVSAGLLHDTRQPEIRPRKGHLFELSGRVAPDLGGEAGGFGGPLLSARAFTSAGDRVVLGGRVVGEWLFGEVPFYEMVHWGGAIPMSGFGGFETLRGIKFGRWRAPGKAIANGELRVDVLRHPAGNAEMAWELAPFADVGTVWGAGEESPELPLHPGAGVGIRAVLDETFIGRLDTAWGLDPVQTPTGIEPRATWGFYMVFDHPF